MKRKRVDGIAVEGCHIGSTFIGVAADDTQERRFIWQNDKFTGVYTVDDLGELYNSAGGDKFNLEPMKEKPNEQYE